MRMRKSKLRCSDEEIIKLYAEGMSLEKIHDVLPVSVSAAWKVLKMHNIKVHPRAKGEKNHKRIFNDKQEIEICERYKNGESGTQLAKSFNKNPALISRILKRHGYQARISKETGLVGKFAHRWNGGISYDWKGYKRLYKPDHPSSVKGGLIIEHRLIMENFLGRRLLPGEVVHHKNGIKTDNRIENLEVMSASEHSRLHNKKQGFSLTFS